MSEKTAPAKQASRPQSETKDVVVGEGLENVTKGGTYKRVGDDVELVDAATKPSTLSERKELNEKAKKAKETK